MNKRKAFDSKKMRIQAVAQENPELVQIIKKVEKEEKKKAATSSKSGGGGGGGARAQQQDAPVGGKGGGGGGGLPKWKEQSKAFREAMKASRQVGFRLVV